MRKNSPPIEALYEFNAQLKYVIQKHPVYPLRTRIRKTDIQDVVATVVCMIFTWIKYGKPDVSMCLNASLAGLVAITAPCDVTDALGAAIIVVVC